MRYEMTTDTASFDLRQIVRDTQGALRAIYGMSKGIVSGSERKAGRSGRIVSRLSSRAFPSVSIYYIFGARVSAESWRTSEAEEFKSRVMSFAEVNRNARARASATFFRSVVNMTRDTSNVVAERYDGDKEGSMPRKNTAQGRWKS